MQALHWYHLHIIVNLAKCKMEAASSQMSIRVCYMVDHIENTRSSLTGCCVWQRRGISMAKIYPQNTKNLGIETFKQMKPWLSTDYLKLPKNRVRLLIKAFQSHDELTYQLIQDYKVYLFSWNTVVAKNNVSEVRELFLACVRQRTRVSVEKELFILSSASV